MARCGCSTAECIINNYWACKTVGCRNGPAVTVQPEVSTSWNEYTLDLRKVFPFPSFGLCAGNDLNTIFAHCTRQAHGGWHIDANPGYRLSWEAHNGLGLTWLAMSEDDASEPLPLYWRRTP